MPDSSGAVNLGAVSPEEQQAIDKLADEHPEAATEETPKVPVATAFLVVVNQSGDISVAPASVADTLALETIHPTDDIIYGACAVVMRDISTISTATQTVQLQLQQAHAMQQQAQANALAQGLNLPGRGK